jgi:hypothetical protein
MSAHLSRRRSQFDGALAPGRVATPTCGGCCCCCCCIATAIGGIAFPALDVNGYANRSRLPAGTRGLLTLGAALGLVPLSALAVLFLLFVVSPLLGGSASLALMGVVPSAVVLALMYWRAGAPWSRGLLVTALASAFFGVEVVAGLMLLLTSAWPLYLVLAAGAGLAAVWIGIAVRRSHLRQPPPAPPTSSDA